MLIKLFHCFMREINIHLRLNITYFLSKGIKITYFNELKIKYVRIIMSYIKKIKIKFY